MLLGQCERLKEALMKLRDISVVEKQEHEKKLAEVTKRADEVSRLEGMSVCSSAITCCCAYYTSDYG